LAGEKKKKRGLQKLKTKKNIVPVKRHQVKEKKACLAGRRGNRGEKKKLKGGQKTGKRTTTSAPQDHMASVVNKEWNGKGPGGLGTGTELAYLLMRSGKGKGVRVS